MVVDYGSIGCKIRYFRIQRGLSQEELAEFADVSPVYISNVENGEKRASLKTLIAIANALNITADALLADNLSAMAEFRNEELFMVFSDCPKEINDILLESADLIKKVLMKYRIYK